MAGGEDWSCAASLKVAGDVQHQISHALKLARAWEAADQQSRQIAQSSSDVNAVGHAHARSKPRNPSTHGHVQPEQSRTFGTGPGSSDSGSRLRCFNCGQHGHHAKEESCPAVVTTCGNCRKLNHFSSRCRSAPTRTKNKHGRGRGRAYQRRWIPLRHSSSTTRWTLLFEYPEPLGSQRASLSKFMELTLKFLWYLARFATWLDWTRSANSRWIWIFGHAVAVFVLMVATNSPFVECSTRFSSSTRQPCKTKLSWYEEQENSFSERPLRFLFTLSYCLKSTLCVLRQSNYEKKIPTVFHSVGKLERFQTRFHVDVEVPPVAQNQRRESESNIADSLSPLLDPDHQCSETH